ncbi:hypothetical protein CCUS01_01297 [Colletotrichum cuscutae]|uniref:Uncharacterized protein n=3 Tax=Colletotrichum acutatum species complex TaxID=2707335 RepID=A0AAI9YL33_9PEZI|nr:uncharacterized protein CCOS01_13260 [Colletotrichum costaricense]XP_060376645.1 uncharacterized protein CTAM01_12731 [Colletotrichum tamarilloi]KAI3543693.1 hypothetical protein CSPX01_06016 [Colletotrichum filicis]KAK1466447.1 hypothetical protein CCUS01_01297 [Colletotrichum cuscutae]KAK1485105.1 hypothetical protein CTAM01_12731 [Colletotrichum tamarilloi]KAK1515067.1 hypothetical protein CCOS01_13260 [Colletotrichum costaricense]
MDQDPLRALATNRCCALFSQAPVLRSRFQR